MSNVAVSQLLGVLVGPNRTVDDPRALDDGMQWDAFEHVYYTLHRFTGPAQGAAP